MEKLEHLKEINCISEFLFKAFIYYLLKSSETNDSLELTHQAHSLFDMILKDMTIEEPSQSLMNYYLMVYEDIYIYIYYPLLSIKRIHYISSIKS